MLFRLNLGFIFNFPNKNIVLFIIRLTFWLKHVARLQQVYLEIQRFTLNSSTDTVTEQIFVTTKNLQTPPTPPPPPIESVTFTHRWTSACNLRVDRDSTPGARAARKTKHKPSTVFIFQCYFRADSASSCGCAVALFLEPRREITHSAGSKNNADSGWTTRQPSRVKDKPSKSVARSGKVPIWEFIKKLVLKEGSCLESLPLLMLPAAKSYSSSYFLSPSYFFLSSHTVPHSPSFPCSSSSLMGSEPPTFTESRRDFPSLGSLRGRLHHWLPTERMSAVKYAHLIMGIWICDVTMSPAVQIVP